jgi:CysZ protein
MMNRPQQAGGIGTMDLISGIAYNLRGLRLALKTPKLLALGLLRFAVALLITIVAAGLIVVYHKEILGVVWAKPASQWILWLWYLVSWVLALFLLGLSAILSYLLSQILFGVLIMDYMSRITERMLAADEKKLEQASFVRQLIYLVKQEVPRTILPVLATLVLMVLGWFTPLGPVVAILSSAVTAIFLAWDNTDLVPARRFYPFKARLRLLGRSLSFHLGFGLLFLLPGLNLLFLSFAPVGATLYFIDKDRDRQGS